MEINAFTVLNIATKLSILSVIAIVFCKYILKYDGIPSTSILIIIFVSAISNSMYYILKKRGL
jgi:hypothetical protein